MSTVSNVNDDKNLNSGPALLVKENDSAVLTALSQHQRAETPIPADSVNSGITVETWDAIDVTVKPVDRRTVEGSTPGDFREGAASAVLPGNPGPRDGMTQSKVGR